MVMSMISVCTYISADRPTSAEACVSSVMRELANVFISRGLPDGKSEDKPHNSKHHQILKSCVPAHVHNQ